MQNFVIIGAMKSATSSMHFMLDRHPEISMSRGKEINYFLNGEDGSVYEPTYEDNFNINDSTKVMGEASPRYSYSQNGVNVSTRIHAQLPEAHIVYQVRNPVERMVSHYLHMARSNRTSGSLSEMIKSDSKYLDTSDYPMQYASYASLFSERFHWIDFDDVTSDPYSVANKIIDLFGLTGGLLNSSENAHFNKNDKVRPDPVSSPVSSKIYQWGVKYHKKLRVVPQPIREFGKKVLAGKKGLDTSSSEFTEEVGKAVKENYSRISDIIDGTEELTGRDYSSWKKSLTL